MSKQLFSSSGHKGCSLLVSAEVLAFVDGIVQNDGRVTAYWLRVHIGLAFQWYGSSMLGSSGDDE